MSDSRGIAHPYKYFYMSFLDRGDYGSVHLLKDLASNKTVIMKESNKNGKRSIYNEIKIMATLNHPNMPRSFGLISGEVEGFNFLFNSVCMVMEYLPGSNVQKMIEFKHVFSKVTMKKFMVDMAESLMYLKEKKIIHVDIKPGNIICNDDHFKLIDFGLSIQLSENSCYRGIYKKPTLSGTPYYMAPECFFEREYSYSTDLFSLGTSMHYMITREMPFPSKGMRELKAQLDAMEYPGTKIPMYDKILKSIICNKEDRISTDDFYEAALDFDSI